MPVLDKKRRYLHRAYRVWRNATLWLDSHLAKLPYRLRAARRTMRNRFDHAAKATGIKLLARLPLDPFVLLGVMAVALAFLLALQRQPPQATPLLANFSVNSRSPITTSIDFAPYTESAPSLPSASGTDTTLQAIYKPAVLANVDIDSTKAVPHIAPDTAAVTTVAIPHRPPISVAIEIPKLVGNLVRFPPIIAQNPATTEKVTPTIGQSLVIPGNTVASDSLQPFHMTPSIENGKFHFYEQVRIDTDKFLNELENVIFTTGPHAAELVVEASASEYRYVRGQHTLAVATHRLEQHSLRDQAMHRATGKLGEIEDTALTVIALADRAATFKKIGDQQAAAQATDDAQRHYLIIDTAIEKVVAGCAIANSNLNVGNAALAALNLDAAVQAAQQLNDKTLQRALRHLSICEARNGLGARANLRLAQMTNGYFKTITALTVSHLLEIQNLLTASQQAREHGYRAAKAIVDIDEKLNRALRRRLPAG